MPRPTSARTPHEVVKRVEGLADELGLRRQYLLAETYSYLLGRGRRNRHVSAYSIQVQVELVEQYFMIISGFQPSLVDLFRQARIKGRTKMKNIENDTQRTARLKFQEQACTANYTDNLYQRSLKNRNLYQHNRHQSTPLI